MCSSKQLLIFLQILFRLTTLQLRDNSRKPLHCSLGKARGPGNSSTRMWCTSTIVGLFFNSDINTHFLYVWPRLNCLEYSWNLICFYLWLNYATSIVKEWEDHQARSKMSRNLKLLNIFWRLSRPIPNIVSET